MAAVLLLAGVSTGRADDAKPDAGWATITGKVTWAKGDLPTNPPVNMTGNPDAKHCSAKGEIASEEIVVDPTTKAVKNVFVYIKKKPKKFHPSYPATDDDVKKADEAAFEKANGFKYEDAAAALAGGKITCEKLTGPAVLDQVSCRYVPHALAIRQGQKLLVKNPEPVNHNVNVTAFEDSNKQNVNMPPKSIQLVDLTAETSVIPVVCNVHGWMKMSIMVLDHPYFAVTGADGTFTLKNVPPGEHTLVIRNADGKYIEKALTVTAPADQTTLIAVPWK
jgi:hypothetical protein